MTSGSPSFTRHKLLNLVHSVTDAPRGPASGVPGHLQRVERRPRWHLVGLWRRKGPLPGEAWNALCT